MHGLQADEKKMQSIQNNDISPGKHVRERNPLFGWTATYRPLDIPTDNWSPAPSTGTSINIFCPGSEGKIYPHQKFNDKETQGN